MSDQDVIRTCNICGARNAAEAQFCGICGRELLEEPAGSDTVFQSNPATTSQQVDISTHSAGASGQEQAARQLAEMEAASQASAEDTMQKRCSWCGALNPWVAAVCESCEARFPVPGQDEAFLRAAEERLRQQEASLERLRQQRRRPWRRWF